MRYSRLSCVGSITSSYILSPHKKSIGWAVGVEITSRRYYGRRTPNLEGRMAEWLRPADCEVLTIKLRGINYQFVHLVSKKRSLYSTSCLFQSRPRFYMAGIDHILLTIKLRGIDYQYAHLVSEKSPYGTSRWFQSRPRFYMAGIDHI